MLRLINSKVDDFEGGYFVSCRSFNMSKAFDSSK